MSSSSTNPGFEPEHNRHEEAARTAAQAPDGARNGHSDALSAALAGSGSPARAGRRWEHGPRTDWPAWTAPAALASAFILALVGGIFVDIPATLLGVHVNAAHIPGGLELADTAVQDLAFVLAGVIFARVGARAVAAWQFGFRPPYMRIGKAALAVIGLYIAFLVFDFLWVSILHVSERDKVLESFGAGEGATLLALSAALTCVMAPICEEIIFRGYFFGALSNWRGPWPAAVITGIVFGAAHTGSAPVMDLVPLGVLGFGLCLLYRASGSLYLCIAVHSLNNSIAFGTLEGWAWWKVAALAFVSLAAIGLIAELFKRAGVIAREPDRANEPSYA